VAIATVSAALNRSAPVSEETRKRVLEAARLLGYTPNGVARSLRRGHTRLIALVVSDITNPFFGALARAVETAALEAGFAVIVSNTDEDPARELQALRLLREQRVAGVILAPCGLGAEHPAMIEASAPLPLVAVDRELAGLERDFVGLDNLAAGRIATEYLIRLGHRRIGFVGGRAGLANAEARRSGFEAALRAAGIEPEPGLIVSGGFREVEAFDAVQPLLTRPDRPSALVAANNVMALGCMQAIRELGFRCPEDVSIVGIDDMPWSTALSPPLTVVAQPIESIAQSACARLLARIEQAAGDDWHHEFHSPALVIRDSCLTLRRASDRDRAALRTDISD
jgi:LacI family transcriptional regulator